MMKHFLRLLDFAGDQLGLPLSPGGPYIEFLQTWGERGVELASLLACRNGFFAFESCLLVRPFGKNTVPKGIEHWNAREYWVREYELDGESPLFFAEDIFGHPYVIRNERVQKFDPETGEFEDFEDTLTRWSDSVVREYKLETGFPLGHLWQEEHGAIPAGFRLCPKVPFVCGGKFKVENLFLIEDHKGMLSRANLARQIRDCPDGTQIVFKIVD